MVGSQYKSLGDLIEMYGFWIVELEGFHVPKNLPRHEASFRRSQLDIAINRSNFPAYMIDHNAKEKNNALYELTRHKVTRMPINHELGDLHMAIIDPRNEHQESARRNLTHAEMQLDAIRVERKMTPREFVINCDERLLSMNKKSVKVDTALLRLNDNLDWEIGCVQETKLDKVTSSVTGESQIIMYMLAALHDNAETRGITIEHVNQRPLVMYGLLEQDREYTMFITKMDFATICTAFDDPIIRQKNWKPPSPLPEPKIFYRIPVKYGEISDDRVMDCDVRLMNILVQRHIMDRVLVDDDVFYELNVSNFMKNVKGIKHPSYMTYDECRNEIDRRS
jgi:hypothetical protein